MKEKLYGAKKVYLKVMIVLTMLFIFNNFEIYANTNCTEMYQSRYEKLLQEIKNKSEFVIKNNYDDILSIADESLMELGLKNLEVNQLKVEKPYIIYSFDSKCNEIYYYPVSDCLSDKIVFCIQVIDNNGEWSYDIGTEYVEILNKLQYKSHNYIFYTYENKIFVDDGNELYNLDGSYVERKKSYLLKMNMNKKIDYIIKGINIKNDTNSGNISCEIADKATYTPEFLNTASNVVVCGLSNQQGQGKYGLCWAASVATIVNYRNGTAYTAKNVADRMGIEYNTGGTLENASLALNLYGVMYKAIYNQISWTLVKKNIDQKRPIYVAATSSGNGHAVACFGYKVNNQKKYVYFWNPGTQSTSIVLYKTAGTTFSYNNSVWTWKYTAARNG